MKKKGKPAILDLKWFTEWVGEEEIKNVIDTIEIINNKFYHKSNR